MLQAEEITIPITGLNIAALAWGPKDGKPILALHGWLDNAASFIQIAPFLSKYRLVAIDLPGHGLSDHLPNGTFIHYVDSIPYLSEIMNELGWQKCSLLGHSLGAGISSIMAGVLPNRISALCLIDGLGPLTVSEQQLPDIMSKSIEDYGALLHKKLTCYLNKDQAIDARLAVSKMKRSSVELLINRGLQQFEQGYIWRTDPRLLCKPLFMFSEAQAIQFLKRISMKTCLLRPLPGWPFDEKLFNARIGYIADVEVHRINGNHHIHMDNPELVGPIIEEFFTRVL